MKFNQLMIDILVYIYCKFEMYSFKIAQVISENVRIAFLYVLSIYSGKMEYLSLIVFHTVILKMLSNKAKSRNVATLLYRGQSWSMYHRLEYY